MLTLHQRQRTRDLQAAVVSDEAQRWLNRWQDTVPAERHDEPPLVDDQALDPARGIVFALGLVGACIGAAGLLHWVMH